MYTVKSHILICGDKMLILFQNKNDAYNKVMYMDRLVIVILIVFKMLSVDLSLHIPGVDSVDGATVGGVLIESISRCETELLRESLKDLINNSELEENVTPLVNSIIL